MPHAVSQANESREGSAGQFAKVITWRLCFSPFSCKK
jgi:hypothetical protein